MSSILHLDFETACDINVREVGAHVYARHPSCRVLMLGYAFDDGPINIWVPDGPWDYGSLPHRIKMAIAAGVPLGAHNIEFESNIFAHVLGINIPWRQWRDTAVMALVRGYPKSLDGASRAVGVKFTKDKRGQLLIRKFSSPRKPTKANPCRYMMPENDPPAWKEFQDYCKNDVLVERELYHAFQDEWLTHPMEKWIYLETLRMNERGLPIDIKSVVATIKFLEEYNAKRVDECKYITDGIAPTQRDKLLAWLKCEIPELQTLQRIELERVLAEKELDPSVEEVVRIRLEQGRVSTKKLVKMVELDSGDHRVRGSFVYHGAGTGRFTAVRLQPHNFQRPTVENIDTVFKLLRSNPWGLVQAYPGQVLEAVGSAMRGYIKAPPGKVLVVADYSAIEARVLAWLACQFDLVLDFHEGKDVYVDMAGYVFKKDPAFILEMYKAGDMAAEAERKLGKDTVLGCGYSMSMATFLWQMENKGSDDIAGIPIREDITKRGQRDKGSYNKKAWEMATKAVYGYRERYPSIPALWNGMEMAARKVVRGERSLGKETFMTLFYMEGHALVMQLPSKRKIYYPHIETYVTTNYRNEPRNSMRYKVVLESGRVAWEDIYGAKFVENCVQAISRDLMVHGMYRVTKAGYEVIGTVHDEVLSLHDKTEEKGLLERYIDQLCTLPTWADSGLPDTTVPLKAEGYIAERYRK